MSPASLRGRFSKAGELLNAAIDSHAFPGAVLAIGYQQETAIIPAGHLSYDAGAALVTPDTIYDLASLTKVLATTTAAMILLERGSLRLEAPLAQFLPDFVPPYDLATDPLWSARPEVTIRDLLTHQSGLPAYERFYVRAREKKHVVEEALTVPLEDAQIGRASCRERV